MKKPKPENKKRKRRQKRASSGEYEGEREKKNLKINKKKKENGEKNRKESLPSFLHNLKHFQNALAGLRSQRKRIHRQHLPCLQRQHVCAFFVHIGQR